MNFSSLVNVQKRISIGLEVLQYYTSRDWLFKCDNFLKIQQELNPVDREKFYCDLEVIDPCDFMTNYLLGIRKYIVKDPMETLPKARKTMKM